MKNKTLSIFIHLILLLSASMLQSAPKKLLVVTTTTGYRHSSIPTLERVLARLGESSGEFTVDFVRQPPGQPRGLKPGATDDEKAAYRQANEKWRESLTNALEKLSPDHLKNYDGVVFASTTGDLPIPVNRDFWTGSRPATRSSAFTQPAIHFMAGRDTLRCSVASLFVMGGK